MHLTLFLWGYCVKMSQPGVLAKMSTVCVKRNEKDKAEVERSEHIGCCKLN